MPHTPVLATEAPAAFAVRADGTYIDGTFGRGGHSRLILERLGPKGRLIALDQDPQAEQAARAIRDPRFSFLRTRFSVLSALPAGVDGLLFDLGVSSPQLDDPERGFSFRRDGPLAMRMDPDSGPSAAQWLARREVRRRLPLRQHEMPQPVLRLVGRAQRAGEHETRRNPRARSATLRVAERTAGPYQPVIPTNIRIEPGARWRN